MRRHAREPGFDPFEWDHLVMLPLGMMMAGLQGAVMGNPAPVTHQRLGTLGHKITLDFEPTPRRYSIDNYLNDTAHGVRPHQVGQTVYDPPVPIQRVRTHKHISEFTADELRAELARRAEHD